MTKEGKHSTARQSRWPPWPTRTGVGEERIALTPKERYVFAHVQSLAGLLILDPNERRIWGLALLL